ncbi:tRNA wybutosine-synthesizing protein [Penicillium occitanis (nom. inval.)]|nr:tRNA wybutosine-synthesizing protein [Penicillium occitanis (nom. inval.)]PCH06128.1 hypothetical protein PENOC_025350 [Penicillium occitanis (nom. inval.)]
MAASLQYGAATITPGFLARKSKILSDLSVPDAEYTDLSPKGSVDEGIRDLIRDINALDGLVTTSSCAGRVSIFVEGSKRTNKKRKTDTADDGNPQAIEQAAGQVPSQLDGGKIEDQNQAENEDEGEFANKEGDAGRRFALSGGKGEGRWLYVSHDPVDNNVKSSYHEMFGLVPGDGIPRTSTSGDANMRLIRFHYEPMILHVMTATLYHAHPVLAAASHAGFRESGLQSLRCLEVLHSNSPDQQSPSTDHASHSPVVAVRSAGLALESVIGYCEDSNGDSEPLLRSLVTEEYLRMLVALANERFEVNKERVERFRSRLLDLYKTAPDAAPRTAHRKKPSDWEDPQARKARKRQEGLKRQAEKAQQKEFNSNPEDTDVDMSVSF